MTASARPAGDPGEWLAALEDVLPEARRGFMEDRAPEAAGFLIYAVPRLMNAVRAVHELAEHWDTDEDARYASARIARSTAARALRDALAAALSVPPAPEEKP